MAMLVPALAGSATYVMKRLRIKSALRSSFWLMTLLFSLMVLQGANGCFVPPARRHTISNVLLIKVNNTSKPVDGLLPVHSMNVRLPNFKRVNLTRSTNRVTKQVTKQVIKWVTCVKHLTDYCSTMKQKFSKKGKGGRSTKPPKRRKMQ